jgi:hypothetical protein
MTSTGTLNINALNSKPSRTQTFSVDVVTNLPQVVLPTFPEEVMYKYGTAKGSSLELDKF